MRITTEIRLLFSLSLVTLILTACSTNKPLDASALAGPTSRIRVLSLPNNTYLYPGKACYSIDGPSEIIAHSGGKSYGQFNALSLLGSNKKLGMPETNDMTWAHHEFIVPAEQPLTIRASINTNSEFAGRFHYIRCGSVAGKFTPKSGEDYDAALILEDNACFIRVRSLTKMENKQQIVASEIQLNTAYECK